MQCESLLYADPDAIDQQSHDPGAVFQAGLRHHHIANTAYPIDHLRTWKPYRVANSQIGPQIQGLYKDATELLLYIHIPFCQTKCSYCEYTIIPGQNENLHSEYIQMLEKEMQLYANILDQTPKIRGFDIGGGTPSILHPSHIDKILSKVHQCFGLNDSFEISIETTPSIAAKDPAKMQAWFDMGIRRVSMGVQVTQPDLLAILNRKNDYLLHHIKATENIRKAGFQKFNIDLMYGFAEQSLMSWQKTLKHAISLDPDYITLYRMRYKKTLISHKAEDVSLDKVIQMKDLASQMLADASYFASMGKNTFSKIPEDPGTSDYLTKRVVHATPYIGFGLGAQSFMERSISYNKGAAQKNLLPYYKSLNANKFPVQDLYALPRVQLQAKMISVSFYFGQIDLESFKNRFGVTLQEAYPAELEYVLRHALMEYTDACIRLTKKGSHNINGVIALFYAPSVKEYLIQNRSKTAISSKVLA